MPRPSNILAKEMRSIRTSFNRISRSFGRIAPLLVILPAAAEQAVAAAKGKKVRRRPRLSLEQREALKLQGKYMGTMRGLSPKKRGVIKKIREERGIRVAIAAARRMMNG